ncbi:MAG TPA: hypothetical protein VF598_01105, partial [Hymenobacter sp.]
MKPKETSLRTRLLMLMSAFMLPTLAAAAVAIYYIGEQKQQQFELGLRETTRALSHVVDQELSRREAIARTLAESPTLARGDLQAFHLYASRIAPTPDKVIVLADPSGQQVVNTRRVVSDIYFAPIGKQFSFAVHVSVKRDGKTIYYLSYASYASLLQSHFDKQPLPQGWVASIVDSKGVIAARNVQPDKFVGKQLTERTRAQMVASTEAIVESI